MKKYTHAQRANIVFRVVYGIDILEKYTQEDSTASCILAFNNFIDVLYGVPNSNPVRKKFKTKKHFIKWFDKKFPLID